MMAELAFEGGVQPSEFSEEIRDHGMTYWQALRLLRELRKLRDERLKVMFLLAKVAGGVK